MSRDLILTGEALNDVKRTLLAARHLVPDTHSLGGQVDEPMGLFEVRAAVHLLIASLETIVGGEIDSRDEDEDPAMAGRFDPEFEFSFPPVKLKASEIWPTGSPVDPRLEDVIQALEDWGEDPASIVVEWELIDKLTVTDSQGDQRIWEEP